MVTILELSELIKLLVDRLEYEDFQLDNGIEFVRKNRNITARILECLKELEQYRLENKDINA